MPSDEQAEPTITMTDPSPHGAHFGEPEIYRSGRRKRVASTRRRLAAYALGVAILVIVGLAADWDKLSTSFLNTEKFIDQFPEIVTIAAKNTVLYTASSFIGGVVLGTIMALLRLSSIRAYRWFAAVYIEVFRGLPALLTIVLVGFAVPIAFGLRFPSIFGLPTGGIIGLSLVAGAYLAETLRAGIQAVPNGHIEAARSLGMSHGQTLRKVVLPQAFRIVIPPLTNELVLLIKDTSLLSVLGVSVTSKEITKFARDASGQGWNYTPLLVGGLMYLMITIPLTRLVAYLEKRNERIR
ncbi:MAG: amino acid ABC transporter permease [Microthrixaceae bacterium]